MGVDVGHPGGHRARELDSHRSLQILLGPEPHQVQSSFQWADLHLLQRSAVDVDLQAPQRFGLNGDAGDEHR